MLVMCGIVVLEDMIENGPESTLKTGRRFYIDTHANMVKRHHIVYDGRDYRRVKSLADIPAEKGDEVYIDTLHARIYDEALELLRRGIRAFVLKRTDILPQLRAESSIEKTDENDAMILARIGANFFRELSEDEMEMRKLLQKYHDVQSVLALAKQKGLGKETINHLRREKYRVAKTILEKAKGMVPNYVVVAEKLRLSHKQSYGRVALVELLLDIDFGRRFRKIKSYLGFHDGASRRYNHRLRRATHSLAVSYYRRWRVSAKEALEVIKIVRNILAGGLA